MPFFQSTFHVYEFQKIQELSMIDNKINVTYPKKIED